MRLPTAALSTLLAVAGSAGAVATATGSLPLPAGGDAPAATADQRGGAPLRYADSDLFIEINGTDGDAGLQLDLDGEDWRELRIVDPRGRTLLDVSGTSALRRWGLTGLTFESAEPAFDEVPFARFKARFPAGTYRFAGTTVGGRRIVGRDRLTHRIPARPVVVAPAPDEVVPVSRLRVEWQPVTRPAGVKIVHYQVVVTHEATDRTLDLTLPSAATSVAVPAEFLVPGGDYKVEVLAREASGNQVITEVPFRTR